MNALVFSITLAILPGDHCDPAAVGSSWTHAQKARTRARVRHACELVGGSRTYCSYWDAVVRRESWGGIASAVHTKGRDGDGEPEYGLGPMGLSVRWAANRLPGVEPDPYFCSPEDAFMVSHSIAIDAVERYGADDAVELQAVFGGGRGAYGCEDSIPTWWSSVPFLSWLRVELNQRVCRTSPQLRHVKSICSRMAACRSKLSRRDLGEAVSPGQRVAWARRAGRSFGG